LLQTAGAACVDDLFRRYARYVGSVAVRLMGRDAEVDDVVQEVFLAAMSRLAALRDPAAVKGWLATVTVRIAGRRLRRRRVLVLLGLDQAPDYDEVAGAEASPEDRAMVARIYRALDRLPVAQRIPWTLHHVEGESLPRAAELCGVSLATAKRRIAAAQRALEHELGGTHPVETRRT
jgi:RNA polymerase sigma-70 factor (ECF subfamily)